MDAVLGLARSDVTLALELLPSDAADGLPCILRGPVACRFGEDRLAANCSARLAKI
jgi:hypothetical protein